MLATNKLFQSTLCFLSLCRRKFLKNQIVFVYLKPMQVQLVQNRLYIFKYTLRYCTIFTQAVPVGNLMYTTPLKHTGSLRTQELSNFRIIGAL